MTEQRSPEWFAQRLGKVTASRIADVMAKTKTGYSSTRQNYLAHLVCERLTNMPQESFSNAAMQWGTETEPFARAEYEMKHGVLVDECGFFDHPSIRMAGASPDGLVGNDGLVEIKCPNTATHIDYLLGKEPPAKYLPQMAFQVMCTGRQWCDFVSFDPRMPKELQLFVVRYVPPQTYIDTITEEVISFLDDVDSKIQQLQKLAA